MSHLRWAPDGRHFAAVVQLGVNLLGRIYVYPSAGSAIVNTYAGSDAGWLDDQTLAVNETSLDISSRVVIHALDGSPEVDLPGPIYGFLGDQHGHVVVQDELALDGLTPPQVSLVGHWSSQADPRQDGYWSELGPLAARGWPGGWSPDGRFLALQVPAALSSGDASLASVTGPLELGGRVIPAAAPNGWNRLTLLRVPPGAPVPTPDLVWDAFSEWLFSPDSSMVAGVVQGGSTDVLDTATGTLRRELLGVAATSWTAQGQLVLTRRDGSTELWDPRSGGFAPIALPAGLVSFGPLPGEVAYFLNNQELPGSFVVIRMAEGAATIPLPDGGGPWSVSWAPDGSACYLLAVPGKLLRVSAS